jgi:hypothetical protein
MELLNCKNCEKKEAVRYSKYCSGMFCSKACAASYSTKNKRSEINAKVSLKLSGGDKGGEKIVKTCFNCTNQFTVKANKKKQIYCTSVCFKSCEVYKKKVSDKQKLRCESLDERVRLKEIGRKGGFGLKGYTVNGVYYQSTFEKNVFELLDLKCISFEPHKPIPHSSKVSDLYLPSTDLWIELDGIDREKKKQWIGKDYDYWLEKLRLYKEMGLSMCIFKKYKEFEEYIKAL